MTHAEIIEMLQILLDNAKVGCADITAIHHVSFDSFKFVIEQTIKTLSQEPTNAVSRDAINNLQKYRYNCGDTSITCVSLEGINELPLITQKTGKWEFHCQHWSKCSICGYADKFADKWNYCPNCGAKMENVEKSLLDIKREEAE